MQMTFAIDPGTTVSGWCLYGEGASRQVSQSGVSANGDLLEIVKALTVPHIAIEMVASYGMPVGREVFETVLWIGRFVQAAPQPEAVDLIYRRDVKLHLCGTSKAKDANIRQALLDLFERAGGGKTPQVGTKAQPGPLYGVSSHAWSAIAVAITARAQRRQLEQKSKGTTDCESAMPSIKNTHEGNH